MVAQKRLPVGDIFCVSSVCFRPTCFEKKWPISIPSPLPSLFASALRGGNPYRAKAYARAAENLLGLAEPLEKTIAENRLREIPGIGAAIADIIEKLQSTGTHPSLEAMRKELPTAALEMLSVPGLRPDKILKLHNDLGISSLAELQMAAKQDRLKKAKGFGARLQAKILQGIELKRTSQGQHHIHRAAALLELAEAQLERSDLHPSRITPAGDFRRGCDLVSNLSLVVEVPRLSGGRDSTRSESQLSIHLTNEQSYGATLMMATGSIAHIEQLRSLAAKRGMTLDAKALQKAKRFIASKTEEEIYAALGLPFIEPELREGRGEIELAATGRLPTLVTDNDIRGLLHAHTDRSDGAETLASMAEATRARASGQQSG